MHIASILNLEIWGENPGSKSNSGTNNKNV